MKNKIIAAKSAGLLFIIAGTFIATTRLPSLDGLIEIERTAIEKFEDHRILAAISMLNANHITNLKHLFLMEANIAAYTNQGKERQNKLLLEAVNQESAEIGNWNSLFSKGKESTLFQEMGKEVQDILQNNQMALDKKLGELENIKFRAREEARERVSTAHQNRTDRKSRKDSVEKERRIWNTFFFWFQILGLVLVSVSEILEKLIKDA